MREPRQSIPTPERQAVRGIVAVIPAYNEEGFIGGVVLGARKYVDKVIVVDDGSSDATSHEAAAAGATVVRHDPNRGKGAALNTGFARARQVGAQAVVLLDGDGQHRPDDIPGMLKPVLEGRADMVIGSRYLGVDSDIPAYRRAGQFVVTTLTTAASGISSTDSWSGYRALSRRALDRIHFREGGWGVDPEFQFQAREHGLTVTEVPIVALYEEEAKRNPLVHGLRTVNAILRLTRLHRPLLFFGVGGTLLLILGLGVGAGAVARSLEKGEFAVAEAVIAVLVSFAGTATGLAGVVKYYNRGLAIRRARLGRDDK